MHAQARSVSGSDRLTCDGADGIKRIVGIAEALYDGQRLREGDWGGEVFRGKNQKDAT
jgi:hypothetical protein